MSPEQIKTVIEASFPEVQFEQRHSPDGWAFYWQKIKKGGNPSRLARAIDPAGELKLAITSRIKKVEVVEPVTTAEEVRSLIAEEIRLLKLHFGG